MQASPQVPSFRQSLLAVLGVCFVIIMVAIDQTVVGTALPTIVAELHGFDLYAWVATSYLLMSVITIPVFGRLGDYYGRKPFVVSAIIVFTLASILCAMSRSMLFLVYARALQGIGGGMLIGTALACIPDLFPDARVRMRWQILMASSFGIANAVGPSLGGLLTHYYGWRSVFYINLPVGVIGLWFMRYMPHIRHVEKGAARIDWPGALLIALTLGSMELLVEWMPDDGLTLATAGLIALGVASAFGLLYWERRFSHPVLPLEIFQDPKLSPLMSLSVLAGSAMFVMLFYGPLMLQGGYGLSPKDAGLLITPLAAFIPVGSIINGRIVTRLKVPNRMLYIGFALVCSAFVGIASTSRETPHAVMLVLMMCAGTGFGFILPNMSVFAQEMAERAQLGIVTALMQSTRMVGGMIGTAIIGTLVDRSYAHAVSRACTGLCAQHGLAALSDPRLLVDHDAQTQFLLQTSQVGLDGPALIEVARVALVSSIHQGQLLAAAMALFALWRVRKVPHMTFKRRAMPTPPPAE